ncbi:MULTISPECIES: macrolide efflux RND transporter outer membrane subunit EtsC [Enterobacteriaceae]|uniref:efflux transporter outer membrane subunit n=1 Tax=Enterobacteriaceae TaxID=543 RepID=UPI0011D1F0AA|nr:MULTISPECIES: efflux transporter outer membrane subunit [Enterobacteriaceae]
MKILSPIAVCLAALISAGCGNSLKSDYQTPEVKYPENWHQGDVAGETAPFDWQAFNDPQLDGWLRRVLASNNDVAEAVLRVYHARLEEVRVGIVNDPGLKGSLGVDGRKQLDSSAGWAKESFASLSTSFELDLWGKIARQRDAKVWARYASEEDLRSARLTLLSDASYNYWHIGFINQQLSVLQQSIDYAKETLRLANARYAAGGASYLDVVDAQQGVLSQENRLAALQNERLQALNQQAVLLGTAPGSPVVEPKVLPTGPLPQVNVNIPVSVLRHRPDISAKEWRVREALSTVDIQRTAFYPAFSLTGSLGTSSSALMVFLHNTVGSVGASLTLPFLEWRERGVDVKIARNDYEQRVLEFKQALYKAMSSIDDALSKHNELIAQETRLRESLELAKKSEKLNEVRYRQGAVRISFWLDAQERRRQAELLLDENRFNQLNNLAKIYFEFGGASTFP